MDENNNKDLEVKVTHTHPWENYKKDRDFDAKIKRNKEFLKKKKYKRQFSRGTEPGRVKGETVLLSTTRKYSAMRAASSGEIKEIPFECNIIRNIKVEKHDPLKNKVFSDLTLAQQLEVLRKKNKLREAMLDDENEDEKTDEGENKDDTQNEIFPESIDRLSSRETSRIPTRDKEIKRKGEKERKNNGKTESSVSNNDKQRAKILPIRQPVKLHLDEISDEFSHITFCKLDRLTKAVHSHLDAPISKKTDLNRVDNAIAKWTLKL